MGASVRGCPQRPARRGRGSSDSAGGGSAVSRRPCPDVARAHDYFITTLQEETSWEQSRDRSPAGCRDGCPDEWFTGPVEVTVDREEILVVGTLAAPEGVEGEPDGPEATEAARGRISRFREDTRDERIAIAREAEHRFGRRSPGAPSAARRRRCSPTSPCR